MNNTFIYRCCLLFILSISFAWARGEAQVEIRTLNPQQWPAQYQITLTPPAHYHAYLDKGVEDAYIPVTLDPKNLLENKGLVVTSFALPAGEFDEEVQATVLRGTGYINFTLDRLAGRPLSIGDNETVTLRYQLCDEVSNVCFRPKTAALALNLPNIALMQVQSPVAETTLQEEEDLSWMEQLLAVFHDNENNTLLLFSLMFLAGLLSVATPCVYPMLPITSMLIRNRAQGEQSKEKWHAGVYLIGMVGTYVALGIMAGMTGGAFNSFMQSAFVNIAFAVFFAFFAISLLGYYEFAFMQSEVGQLDQSTANVNGYFGTWLMGSIAGLVISPCVGPIVFALLLQVADNIAAQADALAALGQTLGFLDKLSISLHGGLLMGGFGLGVGLPFFIISVVKFKQLPKAGYWMNKVKYAFGFAILYFAYTYFAKGLGVLRVADEVILMLAWGLVILWIAIVHLNILGDAGPDQHPTRKLSRFAGVLSLILGAWLLVSGLNQVPMMGVANANIPVQVQSAEPVASEGGIVWLHSFAEAKEAARLSGKPIFIDFYASWCANCLAFAKETVNNASLNKALREQAITLKIVDNTPEFEKFKQSPEHRQLKIGLPYFAILDSHGVLQWSGTDYQATQTMIKVLKRLNAQH